MFFYFFLYCQQLPRDLNQQKVSILPTQPFLLRMKVLESWTTHTYFLSKQAQFPETTGVCCKHCLHGSDYFKLRINKHLCIMTAARQCLQDSLKIPPMAQRSRRPYTVN